jgi:hypothetical protein
VDVFVGEHVQVLRTGGERGARVDPIPVEHAAQRAFSGGGCQVMAVGDFGGWQGVCLPARDVAVRGDARVGHVEPMVQANGSPPLVDRRVAGGTGLVDLPFEVVEPGLPCTVRWRADRRVAGVLDVPVFVVRLVDAPAGGEQCGVRVVDAFLEAGAVGALVPVDIPAAGCGCHDRLLTGFLYRVQSSGRVPVRGFNLLLHQRLTAMGS